MYRQKYRQFPGLKYVAWLAYLAWKSEHVGAVHSRFNNTPAADFLASAKPRPCVIEVGVIRNVAWLGRYKRQALLTTSRSDA